MTLRSNYDHEKHGQYIQTKTEFDIQLKNFVQTGNTHPICIWDMFKFTPGTFDTMIELLVMFELCYKNTKHGQTVLRLPWFVQEDGGCLLASEWSKYPPPNRLQFSLHYCFCHRIPAMIHERFCIRLLKKEVTQEKTGEIWFM